MMKMNVSSSGTAASVMNALRARLEAKAPAALHAGAKLIYDDSQTKVPVETGYLKETGEITTRGQGLATTKTIEYGNSRHKPRVYVTPKGSTVRWPWEYARIVHERIQSTNGPDARSYDYLRSAVRTQREAVQKTIAQLMRN